MGRRLKFVFAFQPGPGHWSRMRSISSVLRDNGHEIIVATSPSFRRRVDRSSYDRFIPIGPAWEEDRMESPGASGAPTIGGELRNHSGAIVSRFFNEAPKVASDLRHALGKGARPDLLVFDYTLLGGPPAAEALALPWATVFGMTAPFPVGGWPPFGSHFRCTKSPSVRERYERIERSILRENRELYEPVCELWKETGRRIRNPWGAYARSGRIGIVGSIAECEFPLPARFPKHIRYVGPLIDDGEQPAVLDSEADIFLRTRCDDPLIHVTLGMTFSRIESILRNVVDALRNESLRIIVSTGHGDWRTRPPTHAPGRARVLVRGKVPHLTVLPRVDLLICHGGANTLMKALHFGIPVLVIPLGAEQRSNAARMVHAGIGKMILPSRLSPKRIRDEVDTLLNPSRGFTRRAGEMGIKARQAGGGAYAASLLEKICMDGAKS